jgi:hypothetical protein
MFGVGRIGKSSFVQERDYLGREVSLYKLYYGSSPRHKHNMHVITDHDTSVWDRNVRFIPQATFPFSKSRFTYRRSISTPKSLFSVELNQNCTQHHHSLYVPNISSFSHKSQRSTCIFLNTSIYITTKPLPTPPPGPLPHSFFYPLILSMPNHHSSILS